MPQFSKTLLPPILEYTYPAFKYEESNGDGVSVEFPASLSITNTLDEVDHIQIRIVSLNTNKNGLNPKIFPTGLYFISLENSDTFSIKINTVINGENIFKTSEEDVYPSYYKMQIRLGSKSGEKYQSSWGQNVSEDWLNSNAEFFSEWSNSSILKTVKQPDFGIFTLKENIENIISDPNYLWMGYYSTEDSNESLKKYIFRLEDSNHNLLEESPESYIGEYEKPSLSYKFREIFEHNKKYYLSLIVESTTGYQDIVTYDLQTNFDYVKIYNIIKITEDDEDAHNLVDVRARQIHLVPEKTPSNLAWLADQNMNNYGETGVTHYKNLNKLNASADFSIPYDSFSLLLSITNFQDKIQNKLRKCFIDNNYILYLGQESYFGSEFYLGAYEKEGITYFVLKEVFKNQNTFNDYYIIEEPNKIEQNKEYLFIVKKDKGDTIFEIKQWHDNNFEGGE